MQKNKNNGTCERMSVLSLPSTGFFCVATKIGVLFVADHSYCCAFFSGVDLDCQAYAHDGYDCCLKDAQYLSTWNGTAPRCLADARGQVRTFMQKQQRLGS